MIPRRCRGLPALLALALAACGLGHEDPPGPPVPEGAALVSRVEAVQLDLRDASPPILVVTATGSVPGGGWRNARLFPVTYANAPRDGLYGFSLVADPPDGAAADAIDQVTASLTVEPVPRDMIGVRVLADRNRMVRLLDRRPYGPPPAAAPAGEPGATPPLSRDGAPTSGWPETTVVRQDDQE